MTDKFESYTLSFALGVLCSILFKIIDAIVEYLSF